MPNAGIDPITAAAHIITALQEIHARMLSLTEEAVLMIGTIHAGLAANAIPDTVEMGGTIQTYDEDIRSFIKTRMEEIVTSIGTAFRAETKVIYGRSCPVLENDVDLSVYTVRYLQEMLGPERAFSQSQLTAGQTIKPRKHLAPKTLRM